MPKYFSFKQDFIKERYIEMYEKWCEYSHESFYTGK